jgi:hypothetical protein
LDRQAAAVLELIDGGYEIVLHLRSAHICTAMVTLQAAHTGRSEKFGGWPTGALHPNGKLLCIHC